MDFIPFVVLAVQTLFLWLLVVIFYRVRHRYTLIPLYGYLAVATIFTHNLTDLGFAIVGRELFFLIGSVSFFTTLMFTVLFLYLLEGPRAGRLALWTILGVSVFYILLVYLLQFQTNTSAWVQFTWASAEIYFWSLLAIVVDVFFLAFTWELLSKFRRLPLFFRVFLVVLGVYILDTIIFCTGVFWNNEVYLSILKGNLLVRLILSLLGVPVMSFLLKAQGFSEAKRLKPQNFWEILNFRSDLEVKISSLEEAIKKNKILENDLKKAQETYELVISGSGAGIWDWNIITDEIIWSPKTFQLLGYEVGELENSLQAFKNILHPEDSQKTFAVVDASFQSHKAYATEYRLKTKSGDYRWFAANGIIKYDKNNKPVRMVGTLIDIDNKKRGELEIVEKIQELTALNRAMVGRELKMVELKQELEQLKKKNNN